MLALVGGAFYVLVYTRWLKRSTPQNIVIGGAAGAVPPVVGWAAATGNLTLPALWLFLIVFFWTPPHFWALALLIRRNYEAAGVPMLPVVKGDARDGAVDRPLLRRASSRSRSCPFALEHASGSSTSARPLVLGAIFLALAVALARATDARRAQRLFSYSLPTSRSSSWPWPSTRCSL